jgi:Protein of unknown function (DUF4236)
MGTWRFRKRINIIPGVSINLSKTGVSTTLGMKGFHTNISKRGVRTTVSAPGTGLSYSHLERYKQQPPTTPTKCDDEPSVKVDPEWSRAWTWILWAAAAFAILLILFTFAHSNSAPSPVAPPASPPQPAWEAKDTQPDVPSVPLASVSKALPVQRGELPDRAKTPGDIFEGVTVDDLRKSGYSKRARDVPAELEREIYAWYAIRDHTGFVIDHLVPVELAGRSTPQFHKKIAR